VAASGAAGRRKDAGGGPRHLYIHVPFCRDRCDYCDFSSVAVGEPEAVADRLDAFVAAVHAEWAMERERFGVGRLETVFVGGGTPSLLGGARLERLLEPLLPRLTPHAEITVETNPEDVTPAFAAWAAARRLRVSLGVQSFDPQLRESLGRRAAADPEVAFVRLREAGCENLGIDLMFGLPGQALAGLEADLATVVRLRPEHVSWYEVTIAPGTVLAARLELGAAGRLGADPPELPDDDCKATMFRHIIVQLGRLGYAWYEVSNFALAGHRCRHNFAYWSGRDYIGLGPAAVSTVGELRRRNADDVGAYVAALLADPLAAPPREVEHLDAGARARERLFLAARTGAPVSLAELAPALDETAIEPLAAAGFIAVRGGRLLVTRKGRHVANEVCVRLFRASSF
jgi:oxygen-independent coproporphyrinogen-3 oxidase